MVTPNTSTSSWAPPAQAVVWTKSGAMQFFPPRNRGLPRALTFMEGEWGTPEAAANPNLGSTNVERLNKTDTNKNIQVSPYLEDAEVTYLMATMDSTKSDIDDPPEEYHSFDNEHSQHSINKDDDSSLGCEIVMMSTPTEECIMRHKRTSLQPVIAPTPLSSASDDSACDSPLLPNVDTSGLSLNELVELCTKKMEEARVVRLSNSSVITEKEESEQSGHTGPDETDVKNDDYENDINMDQEVLLGPCENDNNKESIDDNDNDNVSSIRGLQDSQTMNTSINKPLQLVTIDIQLLLQELKLHGDKTDCEHDDWISISAQEMEAVIINCCRETVEYILG